jgi:beta-glucanase (GH16 family)
MLAAVTALSVHPNLISQPAGPPPAPSGKHWKLVWSDEFNGTSLDPTKWNLPGDYVPRSSGAWSNKQIEVGGGVVQFKVNRINGKLVSAAISSERHLEVTQGYFEIRAKLPQNPGYRPAFWLSAANINNVNDPSHPTEIDVMEDPSRNGHVRLNLHWNGYGPYHQTVGISSPVTTPAGEFHTFGVWWNDSGYHFYIDGQLVWASAGGGVSTTKEFIRLGNEPFPKEILIDGKEPQNFPSDDNFTVDYVRVYQLQ